MRIILSYFAFERSVNFYKKTMQYSRFSFSTSTLVSALFFMISGCSDQFGCKSNEIGFSKDVDPDAVFFDYSLWAEEGREDVTVKLQYRMGGPQGTTLILNKPSKVELDGEELLPDSAKLSGAYYEIQKPLASFSGKHTIIFTGLNRKKFREEFEFVPFRLEPDIPAILTRGNLEFSFTGLDSLDFIRVVLTDTSFESPDINEIDTVKNGKLIVPADHLSNVVNGPINLEFHMEYERPVKNGTKEGGRFTINYSLRRAFELKEIQNL